MRRSRSRKQTKEAAPVNVENLKDTLEFKKDMNRNILLGLTAGFAAITFASTADALDFNDDNESDLGFRGVISIIVVAFIIVLFLVNSFIHAWDMWKYSKLTKVSVNWWYLFPVLILLIGVLPSSVYLVLLLVDL